MKASTIIVALLAAFALLYIVPLIAKLAIMCVIGVIGYYVWTGKEDEIIAKGKALWVKAKSFFAILKK